MVMVCCVQVMRVQGHLLMFHSGLGIMMRLVGWGRLGMVPPPQNIGIGGPTLSGYPNKPLRLRLTGSLMIRGPVGKDPVEALASLRMVGDHHAE